MELRYYQTEALNALWKYYANGNTGNALIALPTGTGKSILPAAFISGVLKQWPNQRFAMITHVKELIQQNAEELLNIWPTAPLGIYSAGLKKRDTSHSIVYGGVRSMVKHPDWFGRFDIIFIDEAHLLSGASESEYQTLLGYLKLLNPRLKIVGMTATKFRMGMGLLTNNGIFTDIIYDKTDLKGFNELLNAGFMAPLVPLRTRTELDVSDVGLVQGEFIQTQLQGAVDKAPITFKALQELCHAGQHRKSWLIFASGIEHAEHIAEQLGAFGVDCAPVHSKRPADYNDAAIRAFKSNELRAIVNYGKLTTGFNHPKIDLIGMLRPTLSVPLWVQMLGRGTRPAEGKTNCIAEGSLVLTNNGLIPIEKVSINDKVWDGVDFVSHTGVIYQGYKEVIEYEGLEATLDHKVATAKGWQTFGTCRKKKIRIRITGIGRKAIWKAENIFSGNEIQQKNIYSSSMLNLRNSIFQVLHKCSRHAGSWLQSLRSACEIQKSSSYLASRSLQCCKRSLRQFKQSEIFRLWRERNTIQLQQYYGNVALGNGQSWTSERETFRQKRQQWPLRTRQFKMVNTSRKYVKSKVYKKVYDITNAGQFNRFTVNGLLVSNCLVMDFARNTPRLGPINDPQIPTMKSKKPGDMPVKICENCGAYNHTRVTYCCNCGEAFSFQVKLVSKAGTEELIRDAAIEQTPVIETYNIDRAIYHKHPGKLGKPPTLKATYLSFGRPPYSEFVCLEHPGLAGKMARDWWRKRHKDEPPVTIDAALLKMSELKVPRFIRVHVNKQHLEILGVEF